MTSISASLKKGDSTSEIRPPQKLTRGKQLFSGLLRERLRRISLHWPRYPEAFGVIIGDSNICEPEEGRSSVGNKTFTEGDAGKTALFRSFCPHVFEIAQPDFTRKDSSADGAVRQLSRIDRAFINLLVVEAEDFRCYSHVSDNLGERFIPSDHVAVRVVLIETDNSV